MFAWKINAYILSFSVALYATSSVSHWETHHLFTSALFTNTITSPLYLSLAFSDITPRTVLWALIFCGFCVYVYATTCVFLASLAPPRTHHVYICAHIDIACELCCWCQAPLWGLTKKRLPFQCFVTCQNIQSHVFFKIQFNEGSWYFVV